ncbi:hypothetical protein VVD49_13420 [Uliginosibacterium sp. H3]|uniref:Apea-like HEPN domain-containing protein n=1 Tax=Uliginosibacterium silvisoli TaxID=3114758 RepID=A0ABU6K6R7_9RHOO|nr:hypothetical protein [Uliginosibacterium sp. H3]
MIEEEFNPADYPWVVEHTVKFSVQMTSARINNFSDIYFGIAQDAFAQYLLYETTPECCEEETEEGFEKHATAVTHRDQAAVKTIVFAAMACEAAIYDIAAIHLGDESALVLDKLDPIGKWLVAPQLICGKPLRSDGPAINSLRTLFPARNELVHAKSLSGSSLGDPQRFEKIIQAARKQEQKILSAVKPAYQAIVLLSLELERLFGTASASIPGFADLSTSRSYEEASVEVKEVIRRCKEIDSNFAKSLTTTSCLASTTDQS